MCFSMIVHSVKCEKYFWVSTLKPVLAILLVCVLSEQDAIEKCSALLFFPFISCHENIDPNPFVASCVSDMCV